MSRPARWLRLATCLVVFGALSSPCFGWGKRGHETVNLTASDLMRSSAADFFQKNHQALAKLANTPDGPWKREPTFEAERPTHFYHWDRFSSSPFGKDLDVTGLDQVLQRLGKDFVKDNGSAVWRVSGLYKMLVTAIRARDWTRTLQLAGVLGHYVGDMSQPMHASSDYDGQSIGRNGVHKFFETTLVDDVKANDLRADAQRDGADLRDELEGTDRRVDYPRFVRQIVITEGKASFEALEEVLSHFDRRDQDEAALKELLGPRLGHGAAVLAKVWDLAVEESGVDNGFPSKELKVEEPAYIPIDAK